MNTEYKNFPTVSFLAPADRNPENWTIISTGDVRHPWKSVHGFSMTAARLTADQKLILICRENEAFSLLGKLNELLNCPDSLNRAYNLLKKLEEATLNKLIRLIQLEQLPLTDDETPGLLAEVERFMTEPLEQVVAKEMELIVSPHNPFDEIPDLKKTLTELRGLTYALKSVKDQGIRVIAFDRQRYPSHPALEARRHDPILLNGKPSKLTAGFLQPVSYHATLWTYQIVRSDAGQSTIWN